ncbi:MAG: tetratricopeptide repeat protein, partial [Acidobacteriota bacterium]
MAQVARWALAAGQVAFSCRALEPAARLYRTALTHLPPEARASRLQALEGLAQALKDLERFDEAEGLFRTLVREATEASAARSLVKGLSGLARVHFRKFQYHRAEQLSRRALKIARDLVDPAIEGDVLWVLAMNLQSQSRLEEARAVYSEIVALRQTTQDRSGEARAWYNMAFICHSMRRFSEVRDHLRQAEMLSRETADLYRLSNTLSALGATEIDRGDFLQARQLLQEAL